MPFGLIIIGIVLAISAYRDTTGELFSIFGDLFADAKGFGYWTLACLILGFIASIPDLRKPANVFMVLLMVTLLLRNKGTFQQLSQQL